MSKPPSEYQPMAVPVPLNVSERFHLGVDGVRALRLREVNPKEAFTVCDSSGTFFRATLVSLDAQSAEALVYEKMPTSPESTAIITLGCAVLARQRMMIVMQKATELGVARIAPLHSERSVGPEGLAHEKAHAWPGQVVRAVRQCRRASVPFVSRAESLESFLASPYWTQTEGRFYLDDRAAKNSGAVALPARRSSQTPMEIALAIGPEGGFTDTERRLLEDNKGTSIRLGSRVLRAETAVLVGVTLLQHQLGDLAVS